ncbi:acyltransferase [bacterium]|nr:acyltransferase [bacterium]
MHFGDEVSIGIFSVIDGTGGLRVGSYVRMGPGVVIYTHNHNIERTDIPISHQGLTPGPVTIEDDVWLGARATILPNVTVGRGSVVAAGAVVTKDVPPFSIVGGVPAKVIAKRKDSDSAPGEAAE